MARKKTSKTAKVRAFIAAKPDIANPIVAKKFGVTPQYVSVLRGELKRGNKAKKKPAKKKAYDELSKKYTDGLAESMKNTTEKVKVALDPDSPLNWKWVYEHAAEAEIPQTDKKIDPVNSPPHYTAGGIETIDFIEAKDFNYRLGNVIKYVSRAGKKVDGDPITDLEKAKWYLDREIATRKGA
jgi:hypothetical protein